MHIKDSFEFYKDQSHYKDLTAKDANHITNNEHSCSSSSNLEYFNEKKMHREELGDIVRNRLHHKDLAAINQEVYDDDTRKESIIGLNNINKNVVGLVARNKENSNLQRDALHTIGKESSLGEQIPRLGIVANEPGNRVVRDQLDSLKG